MKTVVRFLCLTALMAAFLCGCSVNREIPRGYTDKEEYIHDIWQDGTAYCKYYYPDDNVPVIHSYFREVTEEDIAGIRGYFADFAGWMEVENEDGYDFDPACVTPGDYVRIRADEFGSPGDLIYDKYFGYTVWFFDTESCILYYIEVNL